MYVRTWKDTDMVATSDSNPPGSASDEPDAASAAEGSVDTDNAAPADSSEAPARGSEASPAAKPSDPASPAPPAATSSSTAESESTRSGEPATKGGRSRRSRPTVTVSRRQVVGAVNAVRERLAAIVWIVAVVFAVILIAGALLIALEANPNNELVEQVTDWAAELDGPFTNLFTFDGENAVKKAALTNWGLAALAWLVGGKIVSSVIRP